MNKRGFIALAVLVLAAGAVGVAWLFVPRRAQSSSGINLGSLPSGVSRGGLNLVIVTLDTTRADRMGAYGNKDIETPTFDRLAREGVLFDQAVSVAPLTLHVHSSMFTGKFPPEHGVRDNGGFFLGPEQFTLAEALKARGYRTGGFVGAYVLDSKWGINQGFDTYYDKFDLSESRSVSLAAIQRPANEVIDQALPWIDGAKGQPFFAWIHLYDEVQGASLQRRDRLRRFPGRANHREAGSARPLRPHGDHGHGRSRREPRRSRRSGARVFRLQQRHARSLRHTRAVRADARPPRCGPRSNGGRDAHGAGPSRRQAAGRHLRGHAGTFACGDDARAGPRCLLGGDVSAAPLRMERPPGPAHRALQSHRCAASRVVRRRARSPGNHQSLRRPSSTRRSPDRPAALGGSKVREDRGGAARGRCRSGGAPASRRSRVRRIVCGDQRGRQNRARGSEGQDPPLQQTWTGNGALQGNGPGRRIAIPEGRRAPE